MLRVFGIKMCLIFLNQEFVFSKMFNVLHAKKTQWLKHVFENYIYTKYPFSLLFFISSFCLSCLSVQIFSLYHLFEISKLDRLNKNLQKSQQQLNINRKVIKLL